MKIIFDNDTHHEFDFIENSVSQIILRFFKHLRHVEIPFGVNHNPFTINQKDIYNLIKSSAKKLDLSIDTTRLADQKYLNHLHEIYERNYDGNNIWLDFHSSIHSCEYLKNDFKNLYQHIAIIDYQEKGGLLQTSFNEDYYKDSITTLEPGDIAISWAELGKTPYTYYKNQEPNNIDRILELCKPWISIKPYFIISMNDINLYSKSETENVMSWFSPFKDEFVKFYNLKNWTPEHMFSVIPIGKLHDVDKFIFELSKNHKPKYIKNE